MSVVFGDLLGTFSAAANSISNPLNATSTYASVNVVAKDLVVAVIGEQTTLTTSGVSDNLGNTYTAVNAGADAGAITGRAFYSRVSVAGNLTTISASCTASTDNVAMVGAAFKGPFSSSILDAAPANNNNTDSSSPFTCPATSSMAQKIEMVVCWMTGDSNATWSATSPNTKAIQIASQTVANAILGYQTVTSTVSVSPAFTGTNPTVSVQGTMSFRWESNNVARMMFECF